MSTHEKLLPCPFCGGEARMHPNNWLSCTLCNIFTDIHDTQSKALAHWNSRASPPAAVPEGWADALKSAEKALRPFFNAVFNDNGDMTVHGAYRYHEAVAGYWAYKRVRAMISAAPAAPTIEPAAPEGQQEAYRGPNMYDPTHWQPLTDAPTEARDE